MSSYCTMSRYFLRFILHFFYFLLGNLHKLYANTGRPYSIPMALNSTGLPVIASKISRDHEFFICRLVSYDLASRKKTSAMSSRCCKPNRLTHLHRLSYVRTSSDVAATATTPIFFFLFFSIRSLHDPKIKLVDEFFVALGHVTCRPGWQY